MSCDSEIGKQYYDLELLSKARLPIDNLVDRISSRNMSVIRDNRKKNVLWGMFYNITPALVDIFQQQARAHIKEILQNKDTYGYFYFLAENDPYWVHPPKFQYEDFPLMQNKDCIIPKIHNIAQCFAVPNTSHFYATCLYLMYFFSLLANPHTNWITIDYLAKGNNYHQFGTRLDRKMHTQIIKRWV